MEIPHGDDWRTDLRTSQSEDRAYNLSRRLAYIVDGRHSRYLRAIRCYELSVATAYCRGFFAGSGRSDPELLIAVPRKKLWDARVFAELKILNHLHPYRSGRTSKHDRWRRYMHGLMNPEFEAVFMQFWRDHGLQHAVRMVTAQQFEAELRIQRGRVKTVAALLDFSIRADVSGLRGSQRAASTTAIDLLSEQKGLGVKRCQSTMKRRWQRWQPVAILAYLEFIQGYDVLAPPSLKKRDFVDQLLRNVDDTEWWEKLIASYAEAERRLKQRGYRGLRGLNVLRGVPLPEYELSIDPLPASLQRALDRFHKRHKKSIPN